MRKILGIGNALVDVVTLMNDDSVLEKFSFPKGSMQLVDKERSEQVREAISGLKSTLASGGSAANTIHGLAMLGAETAFIGSTGKDEFGDFFEKDLNAAGIDPILCRRDTLTGTAVSLVSTDSERTFATHLGAAVELSDSDLNPVDFNGYDILYIEGYLIFNKALVEQACKIAKEKNMKVALDFASYNVVESQLSYFKDIVEKYVDIVFANEEEAKAFTGKGPEEALNIISQLCEIAVVKVGKEGSIIKKGDKVVKIKPVDAILKDTTGAGDLYASGFLFGYANNFSIEKCGIAGSITASKVIGIIGARMEKPLFQEIKRNIDSL